MNLLQKQTGKGNMGMSKSTESRKSEKEQEKVRNRQTATKESEDNIQKSILTKYTVQVKSWLEKEKFSSPVSLSSPKMAFLRKLLSLLILAGGDTYRKIANYLFHKCDPTALAIFRILFGFFMFLDVPQERGLEEADLRFGDPNYCFFPLFPFIQPLKLKYACILYSIMWLGSLGMMLGFRFRSSCLLYFLPYLYFLLLDKSRWNNHSYLFGLTVILLSGSEAGSYLSVDNYLWGKEKVHARRWNYFMLKFQLFILYFYAAVKKFDSDWLGGYSMRNLAQHWAFDPLKSFLKEDLIEFHMIHLGGLCYDLTVGFLLNIQSTKKLAFFLSFMFHGLNSQIFTIGMFPYVCLASLVLFCEPHEFPCNFFTKSSVGKRVSMSEESCTETVLDQSQSQGTEKESRWWKVFLMSFYILIQLFLPFSHSITKGYNNWTQGLYGYSWDMMVYSWNTLHIKVTVLDRETGTERYLDPDAWVTNDRWSSHADMAKQYSECIERNLANSNVSEEVAVYLDVWKSLNGRFQQRVFDPRVDILKAEWSPWEPVLWVLPLLKEDSDRRREEFGLIANEVGNWTASSNVIFVTDFPGLYLENYMPPELANVSVVLMRGEIVVEVESGSRREKSNSTLSDTNDGVQRLGIPSGRFHRIYTVSSTPSSYMYTYTNATADRIEARNVEAKIDPQPEPAQSLVDKLREFVDEKVDVFSRSLYLICNAYLSVLLDVPMVIRRLIN